MGNPLLAAGRLSHQVTIVRPSFSTDAHNEKVEGEPERTVTKCSMAPGPGVERFGNAELAATAPMRFIFRFRPDLVRVSDRIEADDGRTYEVLWWAEISGAPKGIEVLGQARGETA